MQIINCKNKHYKTVCEEIRDAKDKEISLVNCLGQRYIAAGESNKHIYIDGVPGNALGAYLDGATIEVNASVQDAVGDTMNDGKIIVNGSSGDAAGYAMRGGKIYIKDDAGYRAGIHMKAYKEKFPVIVIGGKAGSFLGEYMAGGVIVVLNKHNDEFPVGNFTGVGMHGGTIIIRGNVDNIIFPPQVKCEPAQDKDLEVIRNYINEYAKLFCLDEDELMKDTFNVLTPNSQNPYKKLYTAFSY